MLESLKEIQEKKKNEDLNEAYDDQLVDPGVQANNDGSNEMKSTPQNKGKRKANVEIGSYFAPRTTPGSQPSLRSVLSSKEAIHKAKMAIARWLYDACIPFNAVQSQYFNLLWMQLQLLALASKVHLIMK
ncbi:hypothetical protein SESBI_07277 [Sesbania bispinosa]|nr:hypothetical protein SESBI_07277 [Sesbania bispinosa]